MKKKNFANKLYYLWLYYKWPLLAGLLAVFVAVYFLFAILTKKETVLSVMLIDCHTDVSADRMESDFLLEAGFDPAKTQAEFVISLLFADAESGSYTMTSLSRFLADIGSEKLDVCGMLEEDFIKYDNSQTWLDLSTFLDADMLSRLEGSFLEKDGRLIGIYTDALPVLEAYDCYGIPEKRGVLGVIYNSPHKEAAEKYLQYVAGDGLT